ncbi:MAG: hypothetical protein QG594_965, partial [Bacteroidota bacterium]|nr:hypothetical protein [Bacteroidota bacterium]
WCNFKKELILNNTSFGFIETPVKIENYDTLTCCLISNSVSENPVPFEGVLHFEFGF